MRRDSGEHTRYSREVRLLRYSFPALLGLLLLGCPRQPDAPEPGEGTPCEQLEDCNPTASCGLLTLCVDGFCEDSPSLMRPCPNEGEPLPGP